MASTGITLNPIHQDSSLSAFRLDAGPSPLPESIWIYLALPGSSPVPMRVLESDSIASVKLRIQNYRGFVVKKQKIVFAGRELARSNCLIKDYGISDGNVLHLVVPLSNLRIISIVSRHLSEKVGPDNVAVVLVETHQRVTLIESLVGNPKIELPLVIKNLVRSTLNGLEKGNSPILSSEGTGGAYFMPDESGRNYIAVFKPVDEEPMAENNPRGLPLSSNGEGLKRGTHVGEGALRETAAYLLDHPISGRRSFTGDDFGFSGVPPTVMARCLHEDFNHPDGEERRFKIGSLQMFVKNNGSCEDMGPRAFPVEEVHKICVLDIRLANADRHAGNILFRKEGDDGRIVLVPIDHGYCLPENFEDCTFEWLYWPQAREPFNSETVEYIKSLDAEQDISLLKLYGWEPSLECSNTLRICTMLLKKGVEKGLTPYDIGSILCRETLKKESKIEEIINEAKDNSLPGTSEAVFLESVEEIMDHHLNEITK